MAKMFDDTGSKLEVYVYVKFCDFYKLESEKPHILCKWRLNIQSPSEAKFFSWHFLVDSCI